MPAKVASVTLFPCTSPEIFAAAFTLPTPSLHESRPAPPKDGGVCDGTDAGWRPGESPDGNAVVGSKSRQRSYSTKGQEFGLLPHGGVGPRSSLGGLMWCPLATSRG